MCKVIIDNDVNEFETVEEAQKFIEDYRRDHVIELGFDGKCFYIDTK